MYMGEGEDGHDSTGNAPIILVDGSILLDHDDDGTVNKMFKDDREKPPFGDLEETTSNATNTIEGCHWESANRSWPIDRHFVSGKLLDRNFTNRVGSINVVGRNLCRDE